MSIPDQLRLGFGRGVPLILQSQAAECGLACLAMVAGYHGLQFDLPALRRRFALSAKGITLKAMIACADLLAFTSRGLRVDIESLPQVKLPLILHWELNHFVVLTRIVRGLRDTRFVVHDPAMGRRTYTRDEFSQRFTGIAMELVPSAGFRKKDERMPLRFGHLLDWGTAFTGSVVQVLVLSVVMQLLVLLAPLFMQTAVDTALPASDGGLLRVLAIAFAILVLINMGTSWLRSIVLLGLSNALGYQMVVKLFHHLIRLPLPWFAKRHVGDVVSRFGSTQPIVDALTRGLLTGAVDGIMACTTLAVMFVYSVPLALLAIAALLAYGLLQLGMLRRTMRATERALAARATEASTFIETARGIETIKAYAQERNRQAQWQHRKVDAINADISVGRTEAVLDTGVAAILGLENVLFVFLAIGMVMAAEVSLGMAFAFLAYKQQFLAAGTRLAKEFTSFRLLGLHLGRLADIAMTEPEAHDLDDAAPVEIGGALQLRDIRYSYGFGEHEVVRGASLDIAPGETVAITGTSGSGKSTLMKIMVGLLEPSAGEVLVDGRLLRDLGLRTFRQQIGVVTQDDVLFSGSLLENIAFFDPDRDDYWAIECAKLARIHEDILAMPMRYESLVGDMGTALSGGQKQRMLLARALYRRPRILFIDEGTAHLDVDTEAQVNTSIRSLGITKVLIAHRPETIRSATRVVAMIDGQIVEQRGGKAYSGRRA